MSEDLNKLRDEIKELLKHELTDGQRDMIITAWCWACYKEGLFDEVLGVKNETEYL